MKPIDSGVGRWRPVFTQILWLAPGNVIIPAEARG